MVRVKRGFVARKRRKKVFKRNKGFRGSLKRLYTRAKQANVKALKYSTRDRKTKKREFRSLWITRINAAVRPFGLSYGRFINGLKRAKVALDRRTLAELALSDPSAFKRIVEVAKS